MRFAETIWLWGLLLAPVVAAFLVLGSLRVERARLRFAERARLPDLLSAKTAGRRTASAILVTLAVALAFLAAAQPQYGKGTRVLPATNLDVVIALDYSKSMYARDVQPSRIERAKIEVSRLVKKLGGARFGAIAFAGEPLSFPLTSDGAAIAQFFRGLDPRDMPVGGTASALALDAGRELFARDPRSKNHEKVLILVTDGEDLEGDPVHAAEEAQAAGIRVEVVQIGGKSPEPIPEFDENGGVVGMRKSEDGQLLTTALSPAGEAQLAAIARAGHGALHEAERGEVGVDAIGDALRQLMTEELSERVETVYADIFHYPLGLCVLLLFLEGFIGSSKLHRVVPPAPRGKRQKRLPKRLQQSAVVLFLLGTGCKPIDQLFERESPVVNDAIDALERGDHERATELLTAYLETGACEAGVIGAGDRARALGDAAFDLGLAFAHAQSKALGASGTSAGPAGLSLPPGLAQPGQAAPVAPQASEDEASKPLVECGLRLLGPLAESEHPAALRARALYLMGNLETRRKSYRAAVTAYDRGILLVPGLPDGENVDAIGRELAHNRAFALRRAIEEEEKKKKEDDQKSDDEKKDDQKSDDEKKDDQNQSKDQQDQQKNADQKSEDEKKDEPNQAGEPGKDGEPPDAQDGEQQAGADEPGKPSDPKQAQAAQAGKSAPSVSQDERMLDLLEQAPTLQQEQAKQRGAARIGRPRGTMEDK